MGTKATFCIGRSRRYAAAAARQDRRVLESLWVAGKPDVAASYGMGCLGFNVVGGRQAAMGDSPTSAIGTPDKVREHLRALQAAGVDQVLFMHQAGRLDHDANCRSLELFAREVMPEFVEHEDARERAKAERLAPAIERALGRKQYLAMPDEIPLVEAYGRFSHLPTADDYELEGTSTATVGALGLPS